MYHYWVYVPFFETLLISSFTCGLDVAASIALLASCPCGVLVRTLPKIPKPVIPPLKRLVLLLVILRPRRDLCFLLNVFVPNILRRAIL